jgi:demethylmenaquinone methyltransferase/2-methoxy-6-polyprenyl-1,4-benzoquinol methylase
MREKNKYPSVSQVSTREHAVMVRDIFASIPRTYDLLNRLISCGQDRAWRRSVAEQAAFFATNRFLDVATGTAELAMEIAVRSPNSAVIGLDYSEEMLLRARQKLKKKRHRVLSLVRGNALALPFPDESFDTAAIAFGIRNVPDRLGALREMMRVVVPAGQVLVLEITLPEGRFLRPFYRLYLHGIVPLAARMLSPNPDAYRYLGDSIVHFPPPGDFRQMMALAGLAHVKARPLTGGITHLFSGRKPSRHSASEIQRPQPNSS